MADLAALSNAIETGDRTAAAQFAQAAIDQAVDPHEILAAMTAAMDVVGGRFQRNEIFVPEMLVAARAMKAGMSVLEPTLVAAGIKAEHRVVIGTVEGDLHDIGKNLVAMMWKGAGFEVIDLGVNVPARRFVEAAREHDASLVGCSALLTTTMPNMREVVEAVRGAGLAAKVIVGGAPTTAEFASSIGADGYAPDAGAAVDVARKLLTAAVDPGDDDR